MRRIMIIGVPIVAFCAFMVGTAGAAAIPAVQQWTARFVCTGNYPTMVRTINTSDYAPNASTTTVSTFCTDGRHHLQAVNSWEIVGILFLEIFVVGVLLLTLLGVLRHLMRTRTTPRAALA
jgi:hypothetical protein